MEHKSTHAVEVVPVVLEKHPDADNLSIVRVWGFTVVVRTSDWVGIDRAAFCPPDNILPDKPEYRFLKETSSIRKEKEALEALVLANVKPDDYDQQLAALEAKIDANTKYLRITVKKLRGAISMGMLLPCPEEANIGDDVTEQLGITHYEPPAADEIEGRRKHIGDDVAPAPPMIYAPHYDIETIYKYAECFEPGEMVYVTEKIDGQNGRYVATPEDITDITSPRILHAGSRTEWKKKEGGSNWWRAVEQNPWIAEWCLLKTNKVLYGEVYGFVQALRYGANSGQLFFRAFDIIDGTEYLNADDFLNLIPDSSRRVPHLGMMPFDFEKLKLLADGKSLVPGAQNQMREGLVVRPLKERQHWKLGRVILKMVSNEYLDKSSR